MKLSAVWLAVWLLPMAGCRAPKGYNGPVDLSGEWAVEWEDKSKGYRETIYVWLEQRGADVSGDALDPNLIPAKVVGSKSQARVELAISPDHGAGFRPKVPPQSTFEGVLTGPDSMEGKYRVPGGKGPWKASRTKNDKGRSVAVTADSRVTVMLTSREYDILLHSEAGTDLERAYKESRRVGQLYREEESIGHLGGWLYECRLLKSFIRIGGSEKLEDEERKRLLAKIIKALNEAGYPWPDVPR